MSGTLCSIGMCSSDTSSSFSSLGSIGKIVGIIIGSILGLALLICVIVVIYIACCRKKRHSQVWAHACPRTQNYGQSMAMYPYPYYPQQPMQPLPAPSQRIREEPPPSYEEIIAVDETNKKF